MNYNKTLYLYFITNNYCAVTQSHANKGHAMQGIYFFPWVFYEVHIHVY